MCICISGVARGAPGRRSWGRQNDIMWGVCMKKNRGESTCPVERLKGAKMTDLPKKPQ